MIVGVVLGVVALAVAAMLAAMRTGNRLGGRVAALQAGTQRTSAVLPALLDRIRRGEAVDVDAELPIVDHGTDEIGEVASAVDAAQRTAVAAAAEEARTRAGANAVFLNIAHRSQAIVHRQLQVLDDAERAENDSDQLARLFQLDHLSTRERRNAENLIIMGGEEPRRRWRKPVPLAEIIRSAVSESEQYTRITLGDTPDRHVEGAAVGDLIHLLAELVDNATSFSPPQCPIDISASIVGRGIAVEIEDRGLGIDPGPRARLNAMLAAPPDFGLLTMSEDARLGLFVVARLADRHGVRVTLLESTYGGVQALVLVPNALLEAEPDDEPAADGDADRGTDGDGAPGREGNGFATPARVSANGRHTDPDGEPRGRDGGPVAHRSPTTTAPDRVAPPQHQPLAPPTTTAPDRVAPPRHEAYTPTATAADRAAPPRHQPAAPPTTTASDRVAPSAPPRHQPAAPQAPVAPPPQAPAAAPPSSGKPALPERRPGSAPAASPASPATVSAEPAAASTSATPATASVQEAAAPMAAEPVAPPRAANPLPRSAAEAGPAPIDAASAAAATVHPAVAPADDAEPDAAVTAALPKVMGVAPLPERRPQGHLAKGLRGRPATEVTDTTSGQPESAEPAAGRISTAMSALQSGTRRSRKAAGTKSSAPEGADGGRG